MNMFYRGHPTNNPLGIGLDDDSPLRHYLKCYFDNYYEGHLSEEEFIEKEVLQFTQ